MDVISISGLEVFAHHGVFREENVLGQKFVVDVSMKVSTRKAGMTDDIKESVDYGSVCNEICSIMKGRNYKLIETVAEEIATDILLKYDTVKSVDVKVSKPWAPVMVHVDTVSVQISRSRHTAYLSLGSNMGDRESYLDMAIDGLNKDEYTKVTRVSDFIETEPYGYTDQDKFLNGCLEIETLRTPKELLSLAGSIEQDAKRERIIHWGPRTLDIDILMYDDLIFDSDELHIPHVEMHKREFVLKPLSSIAGCKRHPLLKKTVNELLKEVENQKNQTGDLQKGSIDDGNVR